MRAFFTQISLDELHQFFNVLNGTMNFLGSLELEKNEEIIKKFKR